MQRVHNGTLYVHTNQVLLRPFPDLFEHTAQLCCSLIPVGMESYIAMMLRSVSRAAVGSPHLCGPTLHMLLFIWCGCCTSIH